jgi:cell division control protein 6
MWVCVYCTLENTDRKRVCAACRQHRPPHSHSHSHTLADNDTDTGTGTGSVEIVPDAQHTSTTTTTTTTAASGGGRRHSLRSRKHLTPTNSIAFQQEWEAARVAARRQHRKQASNSNTNTSTSTSTSTSTTRKRKHTVLSVDTKSATTTTTRKRERLPSSSPSSRSSRSSRSSSPSVSSMTSLSLSPSSSSASSSLPPSPSSLSPFLSRALTMQRALHLSSATMDTGSTTVLGRSSEQKSLHSFLTDCLDNHQGGCMYICGSPGTGKTLSVQRTIQELTGISIASRQSSSSSNRRFEHKHHSHHTDSAMNVPYAATKVSYLNALSIANGSSASMSRALHHRILVALGKIAPDSSLPSLSNAETQAKKLRETLVPTAVATVNNNKTKKNKKKNKNKKKKRMIILVIDEIDGLLTRDPTVLYQLFEWPHMTGSRLILIGIANARNLTDRFLPHLQKRNADPKVLIFSPYSKDQLLQILKQRCAHIDTHTHTDVDVDVDVDADTDTGMKCSHSEPLFQPSALELCARKVAASSGDVRKCLDIARQCLDIIIRTHKQHHRHRHHSSDSAIATTATTATTATETVDIRIINRVLRASMGSQWVTAIRALPNQQQVVVFVSALLFRRERRSVTFQKFHKFYKSITTRLRLPSISTKSSEFDDMFAQLVSQGIMYTRKQQIHSNVPYHDIQFALGDSPIFAKLFDKLEQQSSSSS